MKIFLLGLPGSGKTTLGKELSEIIGLPFVDLDSEIENIAASKITLIFKEHGEKYFRELESRELKKWCNAPAGFVMATGGGTPCFSDNLDWINQSGKSVFLDVPAAEIVRRIQRVGLSDRPLVAGLNVEEMKKRIESMRTSRLIFYQKAQITISGDEITSEEIVAKINS